MGALVSCCAAWLITAVLLTLDLLGRRPFGRRWDTRAYRLLTSAGLATTTIAVLVQIAGLAHWPRPLLETLDIVAMLAGLACMTSVIIAGSIQSKAGQAQRAAPKGPG